MMTIVNLELMKPDRRVYVEVQKPDGRMAIYPGMIEKYTNAGFEFSYQPGWPFGEKTYVIHVEDVFDRPRSKWGRRYLYHIPGSGRDQRWVDGKPGGDGLGYNLIRKNELARQATAAVRGKLKGTGAVQIIMVLLMVVVGFFVYKDYLGPYLEKQELLGGGEPPVTSVEPIK